MVEGIRLKKNCPICETTLQEIKKAEVLLKDKKQIVRMYPKPITEPNLKRAYREYRFFCPKCSIEWIYDSLRREWLEVPEDAQFHYDKERCVLFYRE